MVERLGTGSDSDVDDEGPGSRRCVEGRSRTIRLKFSGLHCTTGSRILSDLHMENSLVSAIIKGQCQAGTGSLWPLTLANIQGHRLEMLHSVHIDGRAEEPKSDTESCRIASHWQKISGSLGDYHQHNGEP